MSNEHIIHNLKFDIKGFNSNSEYHKFANRISAIVRSSLQSRISRLFDSYTIEGYHIIVQSIEIDLEYLNIRNLENNLLVKLEKFLERQLINIKAKVEYQINNGLTSYHKIIQHNEDQYDIYRKINSQNQQTNSAQSTSSEPIINIIPERFIKSNILVVPTEAQYLEAILHYLEYGWLPRHLKIPEDDFQEIFRSYVFRNQEYILKYFGRKPLRKKKHAIDRLQTHVSKLPAKSTKHKKQAIKLQKEIHREKFQIIAKSLKNFTKTKATLKTEESELISDVFSSSYLSNTEFKALTNIFNQSKPIDNNPVDEQINIFSSELERIIKQIDISPAAKDRLNKLEKVLEKELSASIPSKGKQESIPFPPSAKTLFDERMKVILDSRNKSAFEKLLETSFYKSITTSHQSSENSSEIMMRGLISIILNPNSKEEIFDSLPPHLDSGKELINQMYKKSPILIADVFRRLIEFENSPTKLRENLIIFFDSINKKHVNFIIQSLLSNYSKLAPVLTYLNTTLKNNEGLLIEQDLRVLDSKKLSETHIILQAVINNTAIDKVARTYINSSIKTITLSTLKSVSKAELQTINTKKLKHLALLKIRQFSYSDTSYSLNITNIIHEQKSFEKSAKEHNSIFELQTILESNYIPTSSKILAPNTLSKVVSNFAAIKQKTKKESLLQSFKSQRVLKNSILRKLSRADFLTILENILPTNAFRNFVELYDKYNFLWKTGVDDKQIQLIFLSLAQEYKEVDKLTIIKMYYDKLQKYKAWTNEFLKKRVIERFENHREYLLPEERELVINYIDNINTLDGIAMKETRKKLEEGIPVKNAGLVLLWPFMKTLFQLTGLIDKKGEFVDQISRERATLLLQYLAVKSSAVEEPYLALNKIMTGYPLEESIKSEITITEKEKDISDALLLNVIRQWPSFTNSSPDNLRGSFIIRDGILSFRNNQWVLKVEAKAYDLLLGKLPWGYSMIRLSWIPYIIKVEWN